MKKYAVILLVVVTFLILIFGLRNCTKTKIIKDLESRAEILDKSLNNGNLQNFTQFIKETNNYLKGAISTLGSKSFFLGYYLSNADKEIILDNVFKRLLKIKEVLLTSEHFYKFHVYQSWGSITNKFVTSLEKVCLKNNDQDLSKMIDTRVKGGILDNLAISNEEEKIRNQKIPEPQYRQRWKADENATAKSHCRSWAVM